MAPKPADDASRKHIVVCVGCRRIKRDGKWTKEVAPDVKGVSSGYCDRCAKLARKSLGLRLRREREELNGARRRTP